ncbi:803_t:CDS:2, partial [Gigaspora rosea]
LADRESIEDIFKQITPGTSYFPFASTLVHNPLSELPYFGIKLSTLNFTFNSSLPKSKPIAKPLKNPATFLTGVMTVAIEEDHIVSNMSENLTNSEITKARETLMHNWDIFVQNIFEEGQTM